MEHDACEDGWVEWDGDGLPPLHTDELVEYKTRNGYLGKGILNSINWYHFNAGNDVVSYRPVIKKDIEVENKKMDAKELLQKAAQHMQDRAKQYDKPEGERSMGKAVTAFNAITERNLREDEGWLLLQILKDVRQYQNPEKAHVDSLEDGIAYSALKAESFLRK